MSSLKTKKRKFNQRFGLANPTTQKLAFETKRCPKCGQNRVLDALSRRPKVGSICSACAMKEGLEDYRKSM